MDLTDFSKGSLWGILPEKFEILARKFVDLDFEVDLEAKMAKVLGDLVTQAESILNIVDGVAVIDIKGPLSKNESFFSFLFGGMTYSQIASQLMMALDNDSVSGILLNIDSPGGVVSGAEGLSNLIYNSRGSKPIVAYTDGDMASAAYWIGSAADAIIASETAILGSIGVLMIHTDYSEMEKKAGIKTTYLTAGKYKAIGNDSEPLTDAAKEVFQEQLDYLYSIFVDNVAQNRGVETSKVLSDMADGRVFIGNQGLDAGLVDNIGNFSLAIELSRTMFTDNKIELRGAETMDIQTLKEKHPDLYLQIQNEAVEAERKKIEVECTKAEQEKMVALVGIQFGEDEREQFEKLVKSGVTPEQFRAVKELQKKDENDSDKKDEAFKAEVLQNLAESGSDNPGADNNVNAGKDYRQLINDYMLEHKCTRLEATRAISQLKPDARENFIKKANAA